MKTSNFTGGRAIRLSFVIVILLATGALLAFNSPTGPSNPREPEPALDSPQSATGFEDPPPGGPTVYQVTSTADYLPFQDNPEDFQGTLRYIIEQQIGTGLAWSEIKFSNVGHADHVVEINLKAPLTLRGSNVSILGQTAIGKGLAITGHQYPVVNGHDVVIRYLRFRSGVNPNGKFHCSRSLAIGGDTAVAHNIMIDHCSIGASQDDNLSIAGSVCHLTVQYCIIGGGVISDSKAGIGSSGPYALNADEGMTFCHNLITNTEARQLSFGSGDRVDFYNNVVGNAVWMTSITSLDCENGPRMNVLYNWYRSSKDVMGTDSQGNHYYDPIRARPKTSGCEQPSEFLYVPTNHETIHLEGNVYEAWDPNAGPSGDWAQRYANDPQWYLTVNVGGEDSDGTWTKDIPDDLERSTRWDMWESEDLVDDPQADIKEVLTQAVLTSQNGAGCRLPLNDPALDSCSPQDPMYPCDQQLVDAYDSGLWRWPQGDSDRDLKAGLATDPAPAYEADDVPLDTQYLSWKQADETEWFDVYFKLGMPGGKDSYTRICEKVASVGEGNTALGLIALEFRPLEPSTIYSWYVVAYNSCDSNNPNGGAPIPVWTFRTAAE